MSICGRTETTLSFSSLSSVWWTLFFSLLQLSMKMCGSDEKRVLDYRLKYNLDYRFSLCNKQGENICHSAKDR